MHPELEFLLRAYDDFRNAPGSQAESLQAAYNAALTAVAARFNVPPDALDRAVKNKYLRWQRANSRPPAIPPGD